MGADMAKAPVERATAQRKADVSTVHAEAEAPTQTTAGPDEAAATLDDSTMRRPPQLWCWIRRRFLGDKVRCLGALDTICCRRSSQPLMVTTAITVNLCSLKELFLGLARNAISICAQGAGETPHASETDHGRFFPFYVEVCTAVQSSRKTLWSTPD